MTDLRWFKCYPSHWARDEVTNLDFATAGFLHFIHMKIIERGKPVEDEIVLRMARWHGCNSRSVRKMLAKLTERGLIVRKGACIWCEDLAAVVDERRDVSQKYRERNAKVSRNRVRKAQQNRAFASPEEELDIEGRPPGAPSEILATNSLGGTPSANAEASNADYCWPTSYEGPTSYEEVHAAEYEDDNDDPLPEKARAIIEAWSDREQDKGRRGRNQ